MSRKPVPPLAPAAVPEPEVGRSASTHGLLSHPSAAACRSKPFARFDDFQARSALLFPAASHVLVAERPADVLGILAQVHQASQAGWWAVGYVAYEAAAGLDAGLVVHETTPYDMPLAWFALCRKPDAVPVLSASDSMSGDDVSRTSWAPNWTPAEHARRVGAIKAKIAVGDTYQCNLTERVKGHYAGNPLGLYHDLALAQRGSYSAYLDVGRWVVASASPELFFERRGDDVLLRPMKGTARRGRYLAEDQLLAERLRTSAKERAENVMIVDLVRNDVGRVARTGSVEVPANFQVER